MARFVHLYGTGATAGVASGFWAIRFFLTRRGAAVTILGIEIVALFASCLNAIATRGGGAIGIATVVVDGVAVVAEFVGGEDRVAALRGFYAVMVCILDGTHFTWGTIGIYIASTFISLAIAISAAAFSADRAWLAQFFGANNIATIARHRITVVAAFIRFEDTVTAASHDAGI